MIISLNWLKQYVDVDVSVGDLAALIGERLVEIESVTYIGDKYKDVVVAKVVECAPLEGTDHLHLVMIDDGGIVEGVERDSHGYVQVVCGAPNVKVGILVAWLPPKTVVPETYGSSEPFVLAAKPLRGVVSNGMLASARELDLYDDHTGILVIDKDAKPGDSFRDLYDLDDYLLDIENKSLTHRPDAFGLVGFAREVAGIQGKAFAMPVWLDEDVKLTTDNRGEAPRVSIDDPALSARFQAVLLEGVDEAAVSPVQLQTYLARSGVRPINAAVDITNALMLLTGQPSHTYDYDKLVAVSGNDPTIHVRSARAGETLVLLDGKTATLDENDIVIAAGETAVGLAGVMGGASTAIDNATKRILLEVATFDLYHLRSTQMRHGIFSEAVTRFTKGIPAPLGSPVMAEIVRLLEQHTGAKVASGVRDEYPGKKDPGTVTVSGQHINETLGVQLTREDIAALLENVGFTVHFEGLEATVTVPYWREDIHIAEDIIEEVGRLIGFDTINVTLPRRHMTAVTPTPFDRFRAAVRHGLVRAGANEVLTYSFVHEDVLIRAGQDAANSYRIVNSISPDLQRYRQSLTPSLLGLVHPNIKAGYGSFALFEFNKTHDVASGLTDEKVPVEHQRLAGVIVPAASSTPYYHAKRYVDYLGELLGVRFQYVPLETRKGDSISAPFEPKRSAAVTAQNGTVLGIVGEYRKAVRTAGKLPEGVAGFELHAEALFAASQQTADNLYRPLSRYPGTERDVCFQVAADTPYQMIETAAREALQAEGRITAVEPVDIYRSETSETKNVTIRLQIASYEKTLTSDDVAAIVQQVVEQVTEVTKGKVI